MNTPTPSPTACTSTRVENCGSQHYEDYDYNAEQLSLDSCSLLRQQYPDFYGLQEAEIDSESSVSLRPTLLSKCSVTILLTKESLARPLLGFQSG